MLFIKRLLRATVQRNGYSPVLDNMKPIYNSWLDRRVNTSGFEARNGIYADWSLPEYQEIDDFEFLNCAIFQKKVRQPL